jgi:ADP-heptose:LPS heptosyltransferase
MRPAEDGAIGPQGLPCRRQKQDNLPVQSFSVNNPDQRPRLLVVELWGIGDVALALPFLRTAVSHVRVTLLAKPHAEPVVRRFAPEVDLIPLTAPWTAFRGKYRLHEWPWPELSSLVDTLRSYRFSAAVSARPDPRDHFLMALLGVNVRLGFPRAGSRPLLTDPVPRPISGHRFAFWQAAAAAFGWDLPLVLPPSRNGRRIVIHTGAAQPTRQWGGRNFKEIADRLRAHGWRVDLIDETSGNLPQLLKTLDQADRFIGNDSGPGHLAAALGIATFTIFGAQLSAKFHPVHPQAAWVEGAPCRYKPCNDYCRFAEPRCIRSVSVDEVWPRIFQWLEHTDQALNTVR